MHLTRRDALAAVFTAGGTLLAGCGPAATVAAPSPSPSASPSVSPAPPPLPAEVVHGPRDRRQVALTFHGQGEDSLVRAALSTLAELHAPVTVFAVGAWLDGSPQWAKKILDGGHELGNHTYGHLDLANLAPADQYAEIHRCAEVIRRLTGTPGRWFRPSQTPRSTASIEAQAKRSGYPTCLAYDVDTLDYTDPGAAAVVANALAGVQPGSIVSLHFGHAGTVEALPELVKSLRDRGLEPVTASALLA